MATTEADATPKITTAYVFLYRSADESDWRLLTDDMKSTGTVYIATRAAPSRACATS